MMLLRLGLVVTLLVMFAPSNALSQWFNGQLFLDETGINFNPHGASTRAKGMGNAYIGLSDDAPGVSWNPAGAAFMKDGQAFAEFLSNNSTIEYKLDGTGGGLADVSYNIDYESKNNMFGSYAYVSPVRFYDRDWAIGLNYYRMFDLSKEYKFEDEDNLEEYEMRLGVEVVKITAATQIIPNIALGVNGNIYIRGFIEDWIEKRPGTPITDTGGDTLYFAPIHIRSKASYTGFNFDIGLQGRFGGLGVGAVVSTPFKLKQNSTVLSAVNIPNTGESGIYYNSDTKIEFPLGLAFGAAYTMEERLTIAADYSTYGFEDTEFSMHPFWIDQMEYEYTDPLIPNQKIDAHWNNINQYRIGAEYLVDISNITIPLRVGYRNDPKVYGDEMILTDSTGLMVPEDTVQGSSTFGEKTAYGDQVEGYILTFGTGVVYKNVALDLAYEYGTAERTVTETRINGDYAGREYTRNYDEKVSRLFAALSMKF
ncbi:MAG: hypothetical protein GF307_07290 [candidate division Zixibacteria bacterium]|nr:hypothetical protein [candidate division Zixibacteria bacterium]